MKFELDLIRAGRASELASTPSAAMSDLAEPRLSIIPTRRAIREATDELLLTALRQDDLQALVRTLCGTMLEVARAVDRHDFEPGIEDFVEAAAALIEDGRAVIDKGLTLQSPATMKCGAVMLELAVRGICAATSIPYEDAMRAVAAGQEPPVRSTSPDPRNDDHDECEETGPAATAGGDPGAAGGDAGNGA